MFRLCFVLTLCIYGVLATIGDFDEWQYDVDRPSENERGNSKCKKDLLLLVDTSASIKQDGFDQVKEFLRNLVTDSRLNVGTEGTKVGLILFSSKSKTVVKLTMGEETDAQQLGKYISNLQWKDVMGNQTRTEMALNLSKGIFRENSPSNYRQEVDDVIFLITDGEPVGDRYHTLKDTKQYAQDLKDRGIVLFTAGVGPESEKPKFRKLLKRLATSPDYSFKASFSKMDEILEKLVSKSCIEPGSCTCDEIISDPFFVQPGKEQAMAHWPKPTFKCATGGKVAIESTVVSPPVTSPHAFAPGEHVINYTYNLKGGVTVSCPVKIIVKGERCGGKPFNCARQVCCCGAVHTRRSGYACCGTTYFDTSLQKCCTNANLISQNEFCP